MTQMMAHLAGKLCEIRSALAALVLIVLAAPAVAVIESYEFDNEELRARYQTFTEVLRCPKCQNQNLSGSNSPIAADLRREVHRLLHEGYSDAEINDFMVARYGEFILYEPPLNRHTMILWFFPLLLLLVGAAVLVAVLRRRGATPGDSAVENDTAARARAGQLMRQFQAAPGPAGGVKEGRHAAKVAGSEEKG